MKMLAYIWLLLYGSLTGTSRYVGMAGAMAAVGGDVSAVQDNPAAVGVYRRSEIEFSLAWQSERMTMCPGDENAQRSDASQQVALSQLSWNFNLRNQAAFTGVVATNLLFHYDRQQLQNRAFSFSESDVLSYIRPPMTDPYTSRVLSYESSGYLDYYGMTYGMNISHLFYWGLDASIGYLKGSDHSSMRESYGSIQSDVWYSGVGAQLALGMICRPTSWLRLGAAYHSPLWMRITSDGRTASHRLPMKTVMGVAFQWKNHGLLSLEADYVAPAGMTEWSGESAWHLKAGVEGVVKHNLFLQLGYQYLTSGIHYATAGISGRWHHFTLGAAYQCRVGQYMYWDAFNRLSCSSLTHQVTVSLAWHRKV